jgi:haloalkane dehalogenase
MASREIVAQRPSWLPQRLFPFESRFVDIDGCQVHYVDEGQGPVLLLLHGNPTWSFLYRGIIERLQDRFRCIALDYPGFGLSRACQGYEFSPKEHAKIVRGFLDELGLDDIVLMGQDWGGPIGLWVAGRQPERFSGFVLGNTFAWPVNGQWRFETLSRVMGGPVGAVMVRRFNAVVNLALPLGTKRHLSHEVMRCYRRPFPNAKSRMPTYCFARELREGRSFLVDVERSLARLREHPVLLVWGELDSTFGAGERSRFEEIFPGHEVVLLETARHFIQEDAPELIAEGIDEWADLALTHFR